MIDSFIKNGRVNKKIIQLKHEEHKSTRVGIKWRGVKYLTYDLKASTME